MISVLRLAVVLGIPLVLGGCAGPGDQTPILIGHLSPLTGPERAGGASSRRGISLAVARANQDPRDKGAGRPVEVLHTDTRGNPSSFGAEATRLVAVNHVAALIGGRGAADIREFKRLDPEGIVLVSPAGLPGESLAGERVFFVGLSPAQRGRALARFAADSGYSRVIVLVNQEEPGDEFRVVAEAFRDALPEIWAKKDDRRRVVVSGPRRYDKDDPLRERARAVKQELKQAAVDRKERPEAILLAGKPGDVRKLREELGSASIPVLFGGREGSLRELLEEPETSRGVCLATAFVPDADTEQCREFVKQFKKDFGERPDVHAALAYDCARVLFHALRQADSLESPAIQKKLAATRDFPGLTGPLSFDKKNQALRPAFIVRIERDRGVTARRYEAEK